MFRLRVAVLVLFLAGPGSAAGPELLDLAPANAVQFFGVTGLRPFTGRLDKIITEADPTQIGVAAFGDLIVGQLGLNTSLDRDAPLAIAIASPRDVLGKNLESNSNPDDFTRLVVGCLGFLDQTKLARDMGIDPKALQPEKVFTWRSPSLPAPLQCVIQGNRLYLGSNEKALISVRTSPRLRGVLARDQVEVLRRSDALLVFNARAVGEPWKEAIKVLRPLAPSLGELFDLAGEMQFAALGVRLDGGIEGHLLGQFAKGPRSAGLLERLSRGGHSSLAGLPPRDGLLFAQAAVGDGKETSALAEVLASVEVPGGLGLQRLVPTADRPPLRKALTTLWQSLTGDRVALYQTRTPRVGQFAGLAVLDCADPAGFLASIRKMVPAGQPGELKLGAVLDDIPRAELEKLIRDLGSDDFDTREKAAARLLQIGRSALPLLGPARESTDAEIARRAKDLFREINAGLIDRRNELLLGRSAFAVTPTLAYHASVEKRAGLAVDVVQVRLDSKDESLAPKLRELLGADWDKIRLVRRDRQVVVLLGSDTTLLDEALGLLARNEPGLAKLAALKEFHTQADSGRKLEMHLALVRVLALLEPKLAERFAEKDRAGIISASFTAGPDRARLDLWIPVSELRGLVAQIQQAQKGG